MGVRFGGSRVRAKQNRIADADGEVKGAAAEEQAARAGRLVFALGTRTGGKAIQKCAPLSGRIDDRDPAAVRALASAFRHEDVAFARHDQPERSLQAARQFRRRALRVSVPAAED